MSEDEIKRDEESHLSLLANVRRMSKELPLPSKNRRIVIREPSHFSAQEEECAEMVKIRTLRKRLSRRASSIFWAKLSREL